MTKYNLRHYDDAFKLRVLSDYYQSGMSKSFISRKWCVSRPTFIRWKKLWPIDSKELSLPSEIISTYRMSGKTETRVKSRFFKSV